jgi:hypothetical protein
MNTPDHPPIYPPVYPPTPESLAEHLHDVLKNYSDEPEAIKAGMRYAILALRRMQKSA